MTISIAETFFYVFMLRIFTLYFLHYNLSVGKKNVLINIDSEIHNNYCSMEM